jgi:UDP-N-acetyl-D-mannosaminuronic acid transferase (WecB/TagA/CpsF family)
MTLRWGETHITKISISANTGQILSRGFTTTAFTEKVVSYQIDTQLVGFYGTHDLNMIDSVGMVRMILNSCCNPFVSDCG